MATTTNLLNLGSIFKNFFKKYLQPLLLTVAILLLLISGLTTFLNSKKIIETTRWVNHIHEEINKLEGIATNVTHSVASLRGYLLTGNSAFEAEINLQQIAMMAAYRDALQFAQHDSVALIKLQALKQLLDARNKLTNDQIIARRVQGLESTLDLIPQGEKLVDKILDMVHQLQNKQSQFLQQQQHALDAENANLYISLAVIALVGIGLILTLLYSLKRQLAQRDKNALLLSNFKAIIEHSNDAIFSESLDGFVQSWNSGAENLLGYNAKEIIGHSMQILIPAEHNSQESEMRSQIAQGENVGNFETLYRHKNGDLINVSMTFSPIYNAANEVVATSKIIRDITERKLAEARIAKLAFYDPLTQLANRRLFYERFKLAVAASNRSQKFGAVLLLDLDNFKTLNDTHGHAAGDMLLCDAARRIEKSIREIDTVARFGGDEFVVLLSEISVDKSDAVVRAKIVAEKIRSALGKPYLISVQQLDGRSINIEHQSTASIGAALYFDNKIAVDDVLRNADIAMYQAKSTGRNQISVHVEKP